MEIVNHIRDGKENLVLVVRWIRIGRRVVSRHESVGSSFISPINLIVGIVEMTVVKRVMTTTIAEKGMCTYRKDSLDRTRGPDSDSRNSS